MTIDYNSIIEYASDRQKEYLAAIKKLGSEEKAAKKLGVTEETIKRSLRKLRTVASQGGDTPLIPDDVPEPPDGCNVTAGRYDAIANRWIPTHYRNNNVLSVDDFDLDFIDSVVKKHIKLKVKPASKVKESNTFDRCIFTDVHIGMSTDGGRNVEPLYDTPWNEELLHTRADEMVAHILRFKKSETLYLDDLGDFCDGLEGKTTRKGHDLPQNMNDKEAFENGVRFKVDVLDVLAKKYSQVNCNFVCESNHGATLDYMVNHTVAEIAKNKYSNVVVNKLEKFIDHYKVGSHTFILCHGKDSESLKFGFKPFIDDKASAKIDQYCKENTLYTGNFIEFSKGDSHQYVSDFTSCNDFDYCSYPAFSPPSNWVKTNFKNTKSGFVFQTIEKETNIKSTTPYFFD